MKKSDFPSVVLNDHEFNKRAIDLQIKHRSNGRTPGTKAFACPYCCYIREFPVDALLHACPVCERCFGSMQAIDYVGAE